MHPHRRLDHGLVGDAAGFALKGAEIMNRFGDNRAGRHGFQNFIDLGDQAFAACLARGARGHNGHTQHDGKFRKVDLHAVALGKVDHVERDDYGKAERLHLQYGV